MTSENAFEVVGTDAGNCKVDSAGFKVCEPYEPVNEIFGA